MDELKDYDGFLFTEEDYIIAPTIYETMQTGFTYIDLEKKQDDYFGLTFDITDGYSYKPYGMTGQWVEKRFVTGPMAIRRDMYEKIKINAHEFCEFDEYNW